MTKKEVEICDKCKKKVSEAKCELCGADMCDDCESYISLKVGTPETGIYASKENAYFMRIITCEKCSDIISEVDLSEEIKNYPGLKKQFIDIFSRLIQLEELEGKVHKKKKPIFAGGAFIGNPLRKPSIYPSPIYPPPKYKLPKTTYWSKKK
jgi:hypothetical protein